VAKTAARSQLEKKMAGVLHRPASPLGPDSVRAPKPGAGLLQRAEINPGSLSPAAVRLLQNTVGNRAVVHLLRQGVPQTSLHRPPIQPKLNVGPAGDQSEQEADRVAEQVMRSPAAGDPQAVPTKLGVGAIPPVLQRAEAKAPTIQRLTLRFGNTAPIPEDARKMALAQDHQRGKTVEAQEVADGGSVNIPTLVYKKMNNHEPVYLVAHGRPGIGNQPALLESGEGSTLTGSDVAGTINTLRTGLKTEHKTLGEFKIEACMSALSRKTGGGLLGRLLGRKKPSMVMDVKSSLAKQYKVTDIALRGNLGFAEGSELEGGVGNTTPTGTEVGLIGALLLDMEKAGNRKKMAPMISEVLRIIREQKAEIDNADTANKRICDLHGKTSTVEYLKQAFLTLRKTGEFEDNLNYVVGMVVDYVKSKSVKVQN
jgi:hypothetical protein